MDNPLLRGWLTDTDGLATRLKALRARAGLSGQGLADVLGWSPSKVSRVENGRTLPSADDVRAWAGGCGLGDEAGALVELVAAAGTVRLPWKQRLGRGRAGLAEAYNRLFAETTYCVMVEIAIVPGPLQTPEYARAMMVELAEIYPTNDIDTAVAKRQERNRYLTAPDKTFLFIITETVLACSPANAMVMVAQLDRLIAASTLPNVDLRVLPARAGIPAVPLNSFNIFDDLVIVETADGESEHQDNEAARIYRIVLERLRAASIGGDEARAIIHTARARHADTSTPADTRN